MQPSYDGGWGAPPQAPPQVPGPYGQPQGWGPPQQTAPGTGWLAQQAPPAPRADVTPPDPDELMSGGHKTAKFETHGQVVGGEIVEKPRTEQQRDFDSRQPKFYDDGNPMWQVVVAVQAQPAADDDDGVRAFYIKGQMKKAVQEAVRRAGAARLEVGGALQIRYARDEPNSRGRGHDKKIYEARYTPPAGQASAPASEPRSNAPISGLPMNSRAPRGVPAPAAAGSFSDEPPF